MNKNKLINYIENPNNSRKLNWINTFFFAGLLLATGYIFRDSNHDATTATVIIIAIWLVPFFYFAKKIRNN
jgi:hypothetical protein